MITENLSTLKIHKLTQAQYDREVEAGNIDDNALYLTPDETIDLTGYATKQQVNAVIETVGTKISAPSVATVGQTIVVKEVDENGKPVSWACADVASGGGSVDEDAVERIVEAYLAENPPVGGDVQVDSTMTVSGAAADAAVVGSQLTTIKKYMYSQEKAAKFVTTSSAILTVDTDRKQVKVHSGLLYYRGERTNIPETIVSIDQTSALSYTVWDAIDKAVKSINPATFDGTRMFLIGILSRDYPTNTNYNYVPGPYNVNGYLYNAPVSQPVYVSTDGSDAWNAIGDRIHPFRTIGKAIASGAKTIIVFAGTYREPVSLSRTGDEFELLCKPVYKDNGTVLDKVVIDLSAQLNMVVDSTTGLVKAAYASTEEDFIHKVFVGRTEALVCNDTFIEKGYTCNLWRGNTKLRPVLSIEECQATTWTWFYDGSNVYANAAPGAYCLNDGAVDYGVALSYFRKVKLLGIEVRHAKLDGVKLLNCSDAEITDCVFGYTGVRTGLALENTSAIVRGCEAMFNRTDGLNIHGTGIADFIDCRSHDNGDDGISHHDKSSGTVIGGEYYGNGKGGVCSPTFGSRNSINGVNVHDNGVGVYAVADGEAADGYPECAVSNCVIRNNGVGIKTQYYKLECWGNVLEGNDTDVVEEYSGIVEIVRDSIPAPATAQVGQTIVVKEVDESGKPVSWACADLAGGGGSVDEDAVERIVEAYLAENLPEGGDVQVDSTMTVSGAAADAKAVGDRLTTLETSIPSVEGLATEEYVDNAIDNINVIIEETDPTVPAWAKASKKPTYTASEVGALPDTTLIPVVPTNISAFANDTGYLTEHQSLEGLATEDYVNAQIEAIPTPDVSGQINTHNTSTSAHADIREQIGQLYSEVASKEQLTPEFANSIEECTDTTKLYVLPDGFIYAYMTKTVTVNPTNQIRESINSDGTQYVGENGEDGYKVGYRFSNSTGAETALASYAVTGFIPCTVNDVIRTKNISFDTSATNSQIHFYDSSFAHILYIAGNSTTNSLASILNDDGNVEGSIAQSTNTLTTTQKSNIAYIRIAGLKFGDSAMVTLNEPLEATTTTTTAWYNSGHAFVAADYEDRIVDLEASAEELDERTSDLETVVELLSSGGGNIPEYVEGEAERVAGVVQTKRTVGSLTFTAMSDPHVAVDVESTYGLENNLTSCRDAGLGLLALQKHFKLDFAAMLGDYTYVAKDGTIEQAKKDISYFRNCMADGIKGIPSVWCTGNHDINYGANSDRRMTEDELFAYITGNNVGTVQDSDNIGRNYGYIDFENQKIRCIYLNTVDALDYPDNDDTADDAMEITAIQAQWLVNVGLDLSEKKEPTKWGIVLFSHHCLSQFQPVTAILTAYRHGESGSVEVTTNGVTTTVNYDFASANRGEIICAVHGHDHNFTYRKISTERWDKVTEENAWLWSICVPNVDTVRNNEKATNSDEAYKKAFGEFDANGDPVYYPKTQGTATSTSFCVITIDRKNRKVHAIAYGAGPDREISY